MNFQPYNYTAEVLEVGDGDTYTLRVDLGLHMFTVRTIRLLGIDTPEVKKYKGRYKYPEEIIIGKQITEWVRKRIEGKTVRIWTQLDEDDVYGRLLGDIEYEVDGEWIHLNQQMLALGFDKTVVQEKLESSTTIEIPA